MDDEATRNPAEILDYAYGHILRTRVLEDGTYPVADL